MKPRPGWNGFGCAPSAAIRLGSDRKTGAIGVDPAVRNDGIPSSWWPFLARRAGASWIGLAEHVLKRVACRTVHIVVVGCGRVGSELAIGLDRSGHSVAIIDRNPAAFVRRIPVDWGGLRVEGAGFDRDVLDEAGISEADALVAVTSGDNTNILAARIARETYDVQNVVARIYDPRRAVLYQRLGIPTVATVKWTTDQVMLKLFPDDSPAEWTDPLGTVKLVQRTLPVGWAGRKLSELAETNGVSVVAITRDAETTLVTDDLICQEGDVLYIMLTAEAEHDLTEAIRPFGEAHA